MLKSITQVNQNDKQISKTVKRFGAGVPAICFLSR